MDYKELLNFELEEYGFQSEFTQKDFGELSERQIRKYENGENYPSYESLQVISSTYGMSVNEYLDVLAEMRKR